MVTAMHFLLNIYTTVIPKNELFKSQEGCWKEE